MLADKLQLNRETLNCCREHGIKMSGPALGRPRKDNKLSREEKNRNIRIYVKGMQLKENSGQGKLHMGQEE